MGCIPGKAQHTQRTQRTTPYMLMRCVHVGHLCMYTCTYGGWALVISKPLVSSLHFLKGTIQRPCARTLVSSLHFLIVCIRVRMGAGHWLAFGVFLTLPERYYPTATCAYLDRDVNLNSRPVISAAPYCGLNLIVAATSDRVYMVSIIDIMIQMSTTWFLIGQ